METNKYLKDISDEILVSTIELVNTTFAASEWKVEEVFDCSPSEINKEGARRFVKSKQRSNKCQ